MKCKVCGCELEEGRAMCGKCGFPVMVMVEGDSKEEEKINELAAGYRRKKMAGVGIALKVYTNEMVDGDVKVKNEAYITLADGDSLSGNTICWYPEKFARLTGDCNIQVSVVNTQGETKNYTMTLANPNIMDFWQVGVLPEDGFKCRIVLGNTKKYVASDVISYL